MCDCICHREINPGPRLHLNFDHVTMHVDEAGQCQQPGPVKSTGNRVRNNLRNQAAIDLQRSVFKHLVRQYYCEVT